MNVNIEKLSPQDIPDGMYNAMWRGFMLTISDKKSPYFGMHFASDIGIKTMNKDVIINIKNGIPTLDLKHSIQIEK